MSNILVLMTNYAFLLFTRGKGLFQISNVLVTFLLGRGGREGVGMLFLLYSLCYIES